MNRTWGMWLLIAVALGALVSCAQPGTEEEPAGAAPAGGPDADATVVDAARYTAEFENDRVRVVRIKYGPGEQSVMHYHPDSVAVFLTDAHVSFTLPDGSSQEMQISAGEHAFAPGGPHQPKNIGTGPLEVLQIELKGQAGAPAAAPGGPDSVAVDAAHYTSEFENDRVRVLRIAYGAGEQSVMHFHPASVAVFLTDHHVSFTMPDGTTQELHAKAGEHVFVPAGQHLPENIGTEPWELVLVELK